MNAIRMTGGKGYVPPHENGPVVRLSLIHI